MQKKLLVLVAALLLTCVGARAQFSIGAGWVMALETSAPAMNGFQVGAQFNIPLGDRAVFGIQPGFNVSMLFGQGTGSDAGTFELGDGLSAQYSEFVLNLPINLTVGYGQDEDFSLVAYVGPVIQYGFISRTTISGQGILTLQDTGNQYNVSGGYTYDHYLGDSVNSVSADRKQFNVLVGAGFIFQLGDNLQIHLGYERSFINYAARGSKVNRNYIKAGLAIGF